MFFVENKTNQKTLNKISNYQLFAKNHKIWHQKNQ
jgi:hypothetical protein